MSGVAHYVKKVKNCERNGKLHELSRGLNAYNGDGSEPEWDASESRCNPVHITSARPVYRNRISNTVND